MRRWLQTFLKRNEHFRSDADLEDEMRVHAELEAEDYVAKGARAEDARRYARMDLGSPLAAIENVREQELITQVEGWYRDIVLGLRSLRKAPLFAATAILTLALGIGANTAIFSFLYGLVLRSLPTNAPADLVQIGIATPADRNGVQGTFVTYRMLEELRKQVTSVGEISGWDAREGSIEDREGLAHIYSIAMVTGNAFQAIPVRPFMGRMIAPYDDMRGAPAQGWPVVFSYGFWSDHYGKDPAILGKQLRISGAQVTVVGVLPADFKGVWPGTDVKMYLPLQFIDVLTKEDVLNSPERFYKFSAIGRRQPGISLEKVNAELGRIQKNLLSQFIPTKLQHLPSLEGAYLRADSARNGVPTYITHVYAKPLYLMQGLVGVVLLLCCVNVGGLMMSKVYTRQQEFAVRTALGAHVSRLVRQYLTESLILAISGSALGALFGWRACGILLHFFRDPMMGDAMEVEPDQAMLFFVAGLAVLTTVVFGVAPAWRAGHTDPGALLKSRTSLGGRRHVAGRAFVPIQVALSLVLVMCASLLSQSILKLRSEHTGFDTDHVTIQTSRLSLLPIKGEARLNLYQRMVDRLAEMPDVHAAAVTSKTPMTGEEVMSRFQPLGGSGVNEEASMAFNEVGPGYFQTMKTRIVSGREFAKNDRSLNVCVLNQVAATTLFPHQDALGQFVRPLDEHLFPIGTNCRVVGIAEDAKFSDVRQGPPRTIYFPVSIERIDPLWNLVFLINADKKASAVAAFRKTLSEMAPSVPLSIFVTLREQMDAALGSQELMTLLSNFFGLVALLLSALGLYGLLSASVVQRTSEVGLRIALGANRGQVIRMILAEALVLVGAGVALGALVLAFARHLLASLLHGVSAFDPPTFLAVVITLTGVTFVAAILPALRAATVDPTEALRG